MDKNKKIIFIIIGVLLLGLSFYSGMLYQSQSAPAASQNNTSSTRGFGPGGGLRGQNGMNVVSGQVVSKDNQSIVVKVKNGSSLVVLYSNSTPVEKSVSGSIADVVPGEQIFATGQANSDGSFNANSIQIRPQLPNNQSGNSSTEPSQ